VRDARRLGVGVAVVVGAVATAFAAPAVAQSVNRAAIDELNTQLLYVALPLTLFVEVTLVYAIYRFRDNDDPSPTVDDPGLEITWTAATAVILVFVGVSAYVVMANPYLTPTGAGTGIETGAGDAGDELVVEVDAYQWGWSFHYPGANVTTRDRLVVPVDRDVRLRLSSRDVIHSVYVPALGVKQDVLPGTETVARTRATETGDYRLYCAELCGAGHARMHGRVTVLNETAYDRWVDRRAGDA
jgi:cytochrome c oxidase subunit 2